MTAWQRYERGQWYAAQKNGMASLIGQQVCYQGTCATVSQSSILKACQFGCGWVESSTILPSLVSICNAAGTRDGAGTSVCAYLISGAGYNVGCVTNSNDGVDCAPVAASEGRQ
ncbi:hypothetical protein ACOJBO_08235 [Rhizobium beringeri]